MCGYSVCGECVNRVCGECVDSVCGECVDIVYVVSVWIYGECVE